MNCATWVPWETDVYAPTNPPTPAMLGSVCPVLKVRTGDWHKGCCFIVVLGLGVRCRDAVSEVLAFWSASGGTPLCAPGSC